MFCDVDITSPDGSRVVAEIRNVGMQSVCDQMKGWLSQGLCVTVFNVRDQKERFEAWWEASITHDVEIISFAALDIPY